MRYFLLLILCVCAAPGCVLVPEEPPLRSLEDYSREFPPGSVDELLNMKRMTVSDAERLALENNPTLRAAHYRVRAAKFRYYASLSGYLPNVSFNVDLSQDLNNHYNMKNPPTGILARENAFGVSNSLSVSYLLFDGFEREFNALAAQSDVCTELALQRNVRRILLRAADYAFYDAVLAKEYLRIYQSDRAFQTSCLEQANVRLEGGLVPYDTVLNFQILQTSAESSVSESKYKLQTARYALAAIIGCSTEHLPDDLALDYAEESGGKLILPPLIDSLAAALRYRPDLSAVRSELTSARYRKYAAFAGFLPDVSAFGAFGSGSTAGRVGGEPFTRYFYNTSEFNYGIHAAWELFSGFSTVQLVRERSALEQVIRQEVKNTFLQVAEEVKTARADCENACYQIMLYRKMKQWALEQRNLVSAAYWAGNETITRLNGAQNDLVAAESRFILSVIAFRKAQTRLRAAIGRE